MYQATLRAMPHVNLPVMRKFTNNVFSFVFFYCLLTLLNNQGVNTTAHTFETTKMDTKVILVAELPYYKIYALTIKDLDISPILSFLLINSEENSIRHR